MVPGFDDEDAYLWTMRVLAKLERHTEPDGDADLGAFSEKKSIEVRHIVRNPRSTWQLPGIPAQPLPPALFSERNGIISGLCLVVVVEAASWS
jgi:hypothetical protein